MPRFVILEHDYPRQHWDLMIEWGDSLRTWRLPGMPESGTPGMAEELSPHRLAYLDYEGPVSGDRGSVVRRERGTFTVEGNTVDLLRVGLAGDHVRGQFRLDRVTGSHWSYQFFPSDDGRSTE